MRPHKVVDLRWTWNGDLVIGPTGDLLDTSVHELLSFVQEAKTRVRSELYEWKLHPDLGASLSDLIGRPNTRGIANEGKARIIASLSRDGFLAQKYITVRSIPVDRNHLMYRLKIRLPDMSGSESIEINLLLDTEEFSFLFV